jgi:hypothetical protein
MGTKNSIYGPLRDMQKAVTEGWVGGIHFRHHRKPCLSLRCPGTIGESLGSLGWKGHSEAKRVCRVPNSDLTMNFLLTTQYLVNTNILENWVKQKVSSKRIKTPSVFTLRHLLTS